MLCGAAAFPAFPALKAQKARFPYVFVEMVLEQGIGVYEYRLAFGAAPDLAELPGQFGIFVVLLER
jgi:hypothetical protein